MVTFIVKMVGQIVKLLIQVFKAKKEVKALRPRFRAPVAQRIEQRFPKPRARVRVAPGVPLFEAKFAGFL